MLMAPPHGHIQVRKFGSGDFAGGIDGRLQDSFTSHRFHWWIGDTLLAPPPQICRFSPAGRLPFANGNQLDLVFADHLGQVVGCMVALPF